MCKPTTIPASPKPQTIVVQRLAVLSTYVVVETINTLSPAVGATFSPDIVQRWIDTPGRTVIIRRQS